MYLNSQYDDVKAELYALLDTHNAKSGEDVVKSIKASKKASVFWQSAGGYIVPYTNEANVGFGMASYGSSWPKLCTQSVSSTTEKTAVTETATTATKDTSR